MKKKLFLSLLIVFSVSVANSQSQYYYYYNHEKVSINPNRRYVYISTTDTANWINRINDLSESCFRKIDEFNFSSITNYGSREVRYEKVIDFGVEMTEDKYKEQLLRFRSDNTIVTPFYDFEGSCVASSPYFYVCLYQVSDFSKLEDFANRMDVRIISKNQYMPNWFTLGIKETCSLSTLEVANLFYESGLFLYAEPDWRMDSLIQSNDPLYSLQWGLKNDGQNCGTSGVDISVEPAWNCSKGEDVVVAIIDQGVQLDHPDLQDNIYSLSYDAQSNTNGSQLYGSHGTCCAGIVGAVQDNAIFISGVAPRCKIMSISLQLTYSTPTICYVNAINWAWQNGADVLSNSYFIPVYSNYIDEAINNALNYGRNGLGCPVLFSSGNYNNSSVLYPASLASTIAVGAMSPSGERKSPISCDGESWGSNYGDELDVVAPGVLIPTTTIGSTYKYDFNGTSAACPHAAGVMALILSANPCLTATEARKILCSSCDKLNGYGCCCKQYGFWNEEVGYGKINAYKAVLMAKGLSHDYYVLGDIGQTSATTSWTLENTGCMGLASGLYFVQKVEITKNITYPYVENPIIDVFTSGYSATSPNNGRNWFSISNITHTSAELKTFKYKVVTNAIGQQINQVFPAENVWFNYTIYDAIEPNVHVNNVAIVNSPYNLNAFRNIETSNFTVQGSSIVRLRAGEEIFLGEGTYIEPNTSGDFYAFIEPFVACENGNTRGEYGSQSALFFTEDENKEEEKITDFSSHASCLVDENGATSSMVVYPNPVTGTFNIRLGNPYEAIGRVEVANLQGNIVFSKNNVSNDGIDISAIPQGMYVVRVTSNMGNVYFGKFVKE